MPRAKQIKVTETYGTRKSGRGRKVKEIDLTEDNKVEDKKILGVIVVRGRPKYKQETPKKEEESDEDDDLQLLRKFDLDSFLGPCRGITRTERLQRAIRFQLCSDLTVERVQKILDLHADEPVYNTCIWDQRYQH